MNYTKIIFPFLLVLTLFSSCGMADEAKQADKVCTSFFKALVRRDYEKAASMVEFGLSKEETLLSLEGFTTGQQYGELTGGNRNIGFKSHYSNGVTTVNLNYTLYFQKKELDFVVSCKKIGTTFKIIAIN